MATKRLSAAQRRALEMIAQGRYGESNFNSVKALIRHGYAEVLASTDRTNRVRLTDAGRAALEAQPT